MMTTRYDEEIRELEARLERERASLVEGVEDLADRARSTAARARAAAVSPRGLVGAFAVGYLIGEFARPRRAKPQPEATVARNVGLGGLVGGAALALIRSQYGSPLAFARVMWGHVDEWRQARAAASSTPRYDLRVADQSPVERDSGATGVRWSPPGP